MLVCCPCAFTQGSPIWLRNTFKFLPQHRLGQVTHFSMSGSCYNTSAVPASQKSLPASQLLHLSTEVFTAPISCFDRLHTRALSSWAMHFACKLLPELIPKYTRLVWKLFSNPMNKDKMNWAPYGPGKEVNIGWVFVKDTHWFTAFGRSQIHHLPPYFDFLIFKSTTWTV